MSAAYENVIAPRSGWQPIDLREIWQYRTVFFVLAGRDVKIRYRQTLLGGLWAVLQPFMAMVIFTYFFNRLAGIQSGGVPYPLFAYAGLVPWMFFNNAVSSSTGSVLMNAGMLSKIYFPRIFIPLAAIGALIVDVLFSVVLLLFLIPYYHWHFGWRMLLAPLFILGTFVTASGLGFFLAAINVRLRDVKYVIPYALQMAIFVTPVIYPLEYFHGKSRFLLSFNPMVGMVTGFRSSMLGMPFDWNVILISCALAILVLVLGLLVFARQEPWFADII
jgi:lipopolysaccharide transport system permease protein